MPALVGSAITNSGAWLPQTNIWFGSIVKEHPLVQVAISSAVRRFTTTFFVCGLSLACAAQAGQQYPGGFRGGRDRGPAEGPGPGSIPNFHATPLMDMKPSDRYLGFAGGLYEGGNAIPEDHRKAGIEAAAAIQPLDRDGKPSPNGAIVFMSLGLSNTLLDFHTFQNEYGDDSRINRKNLFVLQGAKGGIPACMWTAATGSGECGGAGMPEPMRQRMSANQYDRIRDEVLADAFGTGPRTSDCGGGSRPCLTEKQVQVLWVKIANPGPGAQGYRSLCDASKQDCVNDDQTEAIRYEKQLGQVIRAARSRYPNLKQIFVSSRTYAGYAKRPSNPEPFAYEYGFSVKWLIQAQILQARTGKIDPVAGDLSFRTGVSSWVAWGPYLWTNGSQGRSDGLVSNLEDVTEGDGTHPSNRGMHKVAGELMDFFLRSPFTPWFRK